MITRVPIRGTLLAVAAVVLAACGSTATPTPSPSPALAAVLPEVEGFTYRPAGAAASVFVDSANTTLEGISEVRIAQAAVGTREDDAEVLTIAFSFPGAGDTQSVDYMARVLDGLEDGFQAGSERTTDGDAFVIRTEDQTLIMAPWGRLGGDLVFLFALGPHEATEQLAHGILNPGG